MRLNNVSNLSPMKDNVVVDVNLDTSVKSEILGTETEISIQYGEVKKIGPEATESNACPNLNEGETVLFSEFAGYHIVTDDDRLNKLIAGYDIMAKTNDITNPSIETLTPTNDRVLIEKYYLFINEDGLVLDEQAAADPRLQDLSYGIVRKLGVNCLGELTEGDLVGYAPYVGETVRERGSAEEPELRVIRQDDILFINR